MAFSIENVIKKRSSIFSTSKITWKPSETVVKQEEFYITEKFQLIKGTELKASLYRLRNKENAACVSINFFNGKECSDYHFSEIKASVMAGGQTISINWMPSNKIIVFQDIQFSSVLVIEIALKRKAGTRNRNVEGLKKDCTNILQKEITDDSAADIFQSERCFSLKDVADTYFQCIVKSFKAMNISIPYRLKNEPEKLRKIVETQSYLKKLLKDV